MSIRDDLIEYRKAEMQEAWRETVEGYMQQVAEVGEAK